MVWYFGYLKGRWFHPDHHPCIPLLTLAKTFCITLCPPQTPRSQRTMVPVKPSPFGRGMDVLNGCCKRLPPPKNNFSAVETPNFIIKTLNCYELLQGLLCTINLAIGLDGLKDDGSIETITLWESIVFTPKGRPALSITPH